MVALPRELPPGLVRLPERQRGEWRGMKVYRWVTAHCEIVAAQSGMGCALAAASAHLLIRHFAPQTLISFGFAGGLDPELRRGTIVIGDQVLAEEAPGFRYQSPPELIDTWYAAANAERLPVHRGSVVTVKHAVADPACKMALARRTDACAVDMESVGVAEVASEVGLPCMALRAIVDTATEVLPMGALDVVRQDGAVEGRRLLGACRQSPALLRHLLWLGWHAATARRHLDRTLKRWVMGGGPAGTQERGWA
ncbi:MAG TPA: hypothetical protein VNP04_16515 [Alphaproteobacteria bacterium]|nr:hypothetical protein [Alphaproteobacteria bacterium]